MSQPNILLKPAEVPYRVLVHIYRGTEGPGTMGNGEPMVFRKYNGFSQQKMIQLEDGKPTGTLTIEGLLPNVRFSPAQTYKPNDAPVGRYAIFEDGQRMFKNFESGWRLPFDVSRSIDGKLYDASHFPFQHHAATGIPMFECEQNGKYRFFDDDRLFGLIQGEYSDLKSPENGKNPLKTPVAVENARCKLDEHIEAIRRKHPSDAKVIELLKKLDGLYLHEAQLSGNAELVPLVNFAN